MSTGRVDMISRYLTCFVTALGLYALPLLAITSYTADQSWPCWHASEDRTFLILAQDQTSCFCPDVVCDNGTSPGCNATCNAPKQAQCACEAQCNEYGNPSGRNSCECGDE